MKIALGLILLLWACSPLNADIASYGFDGNLSSHFTREVDNSGSYSQQNFQMELHNNDTTFASPGGEVYFHNSMNPQANQSFNTSIDLTLPLTYDSLPGVNQNEFVALGIAVFFTPNGLGGPGFQGFTSMLEVRSSGRHFRSIGFDTDNDYSDSTVMTSLESATMNIVYDSSTGLLTSETGGSIINTVDINAAANDWGMNANDVFQVAIFGDVFNVPVASTNPLLQDNFLGVTSVPEPSAVLVLLPLMAFIVGRRKPFGRKP